MNHHELSTAKHQAADLFTKAVRSHLLSSHDASRPSFVYVSVLLTRVVVHSRFIRHLCVCKYSVSIEKETSDEECVDADGAPTRRPDVWDSNVLLVLTSECS